MKIKKITPDINPIDYIDSNLDAIDAKTRRYINLMKKISYEWVNNQNNKSQ